MVAVAAALEASWAVADIVAVDTSLLAAAATATQTAADSLY